MRFLLLLILLALSACPSKYKTSKVIAHDYVEDWQGMARLEPAKFVYVASPVSGYVVDFGLGFGRTVAAGDNLLELSDPDVQGLFTNSLVDFIKNKDKFQHEQKKLKGEKEMLMAGILSEDEYWSQSSIAQDSYISFVKSKVNLANTAKLVGFDFKNLSKINIADKPAITRLLSSKVSVKIKAAKSGLLLPSNIVSEQNKQLHMGSKIDKGEIVALIADYGKYRVKVMLPDKFSRVITEQVKADVTGDFGTFLPAKVVDLQPYNYEEKSGQRFFPVTLEINLPKPPMLMPDLYIGMPVKVRIIFSKQASLMVPISAIGYHNNKYFVDVDRGLSSARVAVDVVKTNSNSAFIRGNIKAGADVILHD